MSKSAESLTAVRKERDNYLALFKSACLIADAYRKSLETEVVKHGGSTKDIKLSLPGGNVATDMAAALTKGFARGARSSSPGNVRDAGSLVSAAHNEAVKKGRIEKPEERKPIGFGEALLKGRSAKLT